MLRALPSWDSSLSCSAVLISCSQQHCSNSNLPGRMPQVHRCWRIFDCGLGGHIPLRIDESYRGTHKATALSVTLPSTFVSQLSLRQENKTTVNCYSCCR